MVLLILGGVEKKFQKLDPGASIHERKLMGLPTSRIGSGDSLNILPPTRIGPRFTAQRGNRPK